MTVSLNPGDDIQAVLDAVSARDEVILLPGTHPMPTGLIMRNGVALTGSDRDTSILDGGLTGSDSPAENSILFLSAIDDPRTRVSNLTVTGTQGILGGAFVVSGAAAGAKGTGGEGLDAVGVSLHIQPWYVYSTERIP